MLIYKATNLNTNKVYIGQTIKTLSERKQQHLASAQRGVDYKFYNSIRKHGEDAFNWEVLQYCGTIDELNASEKFWIDFYNSYNEGYNMTPGGESNPMHSSEVAEKHLAIVRSNEFRQKVSETMKEYRANTPFSKTHRKHLSDSMKGNKNFAGHTLSDKHAKALQASHYKKVIAYVFDEYVDTFNNVKDATKWYYETYIPKERLYNYKSLAGKIKQYSKGTKHDANGVRWEYVCVETTEKH